jgi:hypothetical protein
MQAHGQGPWNRVSLQFAPNTISEVERVTIHAVEANMVNHGASQSNRI